MDNPLQETKRPSLRELKATNFTDRSFSSSVNTTAGKLLKHQGETAAIEFLKAAKSWPYQEIPNFCPPVKTTIVGCSRPFTEWPIYKDSVAYQKWLYGLTVEEVEAVNHGTSKESHSAFFESIKLKREYKIVGGWNKILNNGKNTYQGVIKKAINRNTKLQEQGRDPIVYLTEDNHLLYPPGIIKSIYCYRDTVMVPKNLSRLFDIPPGLSAYQIDPDKKILPRNVDRLAILKGQPGYIPEWQRPFVSPKKSKRRKLYSINTTAQDILLTKISIGEDWCLVDARGLLRNLYWRKLVPKEGLSLNEIMAHFTGDPVINVEKNEVTFCYKEMIIKVHSQKPVSHKVAPKVLQDLTKDQSVALVSIDLGQTNPVAYRISEVSQGNGELKAKHVVSDFISQSYLDQIAAYRNRTDAMRKNIENETLAQLSEEHRKEFEQISSPDLIIDTVCQQLNIKRDSLPLPEITSNTTHLAKAFLEAGGDKSKVEFVHPTKKTILLKSDGRLIKDLRPKVSEEARFFWSKKQWEIQRNSPEYRKLSTSKTQLSREVTNFILRQAKEQVGCKQVVFNIERLNRGIMNGSGKREKGIYNLLSPKKENRWFVQAFSKAFEEVAIHKGIKVIISRANYTSQTCIQCGHIDQDNREGERFKCLKCSFEANTDLDIATTNLERVALSGKRLSPTDDSEQASDVKRVGVARKSKKTNEDANLQDTSSSDLIDAMSQKAQETKTARKASANAA